MILKRYNNIIKGRTKANFLKSKKLLEKLSNTNQKAYVAAKIVDNELEPLQTARLYFSGSSIDCIYTDIDKQEKLWSPNKTAKWIEKRADEKRGVIINPGNIEKNLLHIVRALYTTEKNIPIIWKSDGYYSEKVANLLKQMVDVYILNFKYFSNECSSFLSKKADYAETIKRNIILAQEHGDLIVDHMILPSHVECDSKMILDWIKGNIKSYNIRVHGNYSPQSYASMYPEISRPLSITEYNEVMKHARNIGLAI